MDTNILKKYAELVIKMGVNLQKNQYVIIMADISDFEFVRVLTRSAYKNGAKEVIVDWFDDYITYERYLYCTNDVIDKVHHWRVEFFDYFDRENACYIGINSKNPRIFSDISSDKLNRSKKAYNKYLSNHKDLFNNFKIPWVMIDLPSEVWAAKVFPNIACDKAYKKLIDLFVKINRLDKEDTIGVWKNHIEAIVKRSEELNALKIKSLEFRNSLGTNFTLDLPENHVWIGGIVKSRLKNNFTPNIPTEEVFTVPNKFSVNGRICVVKPIYFRGKLIRDIELIFKNGEVTEYYAKENNDVLRELLEIDNGSRYMGEIAIVSKKSSLLYKEILFYNGLYDENSGCHFALGRAYPNCIDGFEILSTMEIENIGINDSYIHVDFMFGTQDLEVTAITESTQWIKLDI